MVDSTAVTGDRTEINFEVRRRFCILANAIYKI